MEKILFDTEIFALQKYGGASNYWLEFMSRFIKDVDYECTFYRLNDSNYKSIKFLEFIKNNKINFINDHKHMGAFFLKIINPPYKKSEAYNIFHSTVYRYIRRKHSIKNIITIHDFTHQKYMHGYHRLFNSILKKRAIKHADGIVCISKNTYNDLLDFYPKLSGKKIAIIYNGANFNSFKKININIETTNFSRLKSKKIILYVGSRIGYKNFSFVIKLMQKLDNSYCLCIVGGGALTPLEIRQMSSFSNRVIHYLKLSDSDLNILYNISHCFIYPSLYEGFGIPICEAMNAGCPVISFNNSSIPEVMNSAGILLKNNDLDSAINNIVKLNNNDFKNDIISKQYIACKKFTWDNAYQQLKSFYKDVLEE